MTINAHITKYMTPAHLSIFKAMSFFPWEAILGVAIASARAKKTNKVVNSTHLSILVKYDTRGNRMPRLNR